jgi:hypothetical protein
MLLRVSLRARLRRGRCGHGGLRRLSRQLLPFFSDFKTRVRELIILHGFGDAAGEVIQVTASSENHVPEKVARQQVLQIADAETLCQRAIIRAREKRAATYDGELLSFDEFDGHGETM